jgi:hypothetical protein
MRSGTIAAEAGIAGAGRVAGYGAAALLLALASGYRWLGDGADFIWYYRYYNAIPRFFNLADSRFELGYQLLAWLFRSVLEVDYGVFATLLVLVALGVKFYLFNRYLRHPLLVSVLYLLLFYALHEYTQVRAAVAISFGYWAVHLWLERRWRWAALSFLVAFSFHYSIGALAVVFLGSRLVRTPASLGIALAAAAVLIGSLNALDLAADVLSGLNPLVRDYAFGGEFYFEQNIFSAFNVLMAFIVLWSLGAGLFGEGEYEARMTVLVLAGVAMVLVFLQSPVLSARLRDLLVVAALFLPFRAELDTRRLAVVAALGLAGAAQMVSAFQQALIAF